MNVALKITDDNRAILFYDTALDFKPSWVEASSDQSGFRILGEQGEEFHAGFPDKEMLSRLQHNTKIILMQMKDEKVVEMCTVTYIHQDYTDEGY